MTSDQRRLETLLSAALAARQRGDAEDERRQLDAALALSPSDPRILNARGMRALKDGDPLSARRHFEGAAAADPGEPALWMNVATAAREVGDIDGERQALDRVLEIDRLHFTAQLRSAELEQRRGRMSAAASSWSAVAQLALGFENPPAAVVEAAERARAFIQSHKAGLADLLDAELAGDPAATGDPGRRFRACIDHVLGRRAIYHNECAGVHFPFLPADEFFDRRHFAWMEAIEARTDVIRAEALNLLAENAEAIRPYVRQDKGTPQNKWSQLDHSRDWSACFLWEYGARNDAVCALCPETAAALELVPQNHIPGKAPTAFFSILAPGAHIPPHTGVTNTRAIVHLPLVVPDGCRFRVGGETRAWREGEAFAFDDTIEHEAWNASSQPRIVLIFDVWNPHLTGEEQRLLKTFFAVSGRTEH